MGVMTCWHTECRRIGIFACGCVDMDASARGHSHGRVGASLGNVVSVGVSEQGEW